MIKCPKCGAENPQDARFCSNCGHPRENPQVNTIKTAQIKPIKDDMPMTFHTIYAIALICISVFALLGGIIGLFSEETAAMSAFYFVTACYQLITAILLLNKSKAGLIMRLIRDIWRIFIAGCTVIAIPITSFVMLILGLAMDAELFSSEGMLVLAILFGLVLFVWFINSVVRIIFHGYLIHYYHKRKHLFH